MSNCQLSGWVLHISWRIWLIHAPTCLCWEIWVLAESFCSSDRIHDISDRSLVSSCLSEVVTVYWTPTFVIWIKCPHLQMLQSHLKNCLDVLDDSHTRKNIDIKFLPANLNFCLPRQRAGLFTDWGTQSYMSFARGLPSKKDHLIFTRSLLNL